LILLKPQSTHISFTANGLLPILSLYCPSVTPMMRFQQAESMTGKQIRLVVTPLEMASSFVKVRLTFVSARFISRFQNLALAFLMSKTSVHKRQKANQTSMRKLAKGRWNGFEFKDYSAGVDESGRF
jgi:hypothetical protein